MSFLIGCNYWASNAGIEMWRQFDADVIRRDFKELKSYGIEYLRVFPLWRDFQVAEPFFGGSHRDKHVYLDKNGLYSKRDDSTFSKPISRPFESLLNFKKERTRRLSYPFFWQGRRDSLRSLFIFQLVYIIWFRSSLNA